MKISHEQIRTLVLKEIESLPQDIREGVLDYLKGAGQSAGGKIADTGRSIAKAVGDKATAAKNKVGQVAGDIKNAGAVASLKGDVQKAVQESGMAMERFKSTFTDLLARAQSLRLDDEEQVIKSELGAIEQYQMNAGNVGGDLGDEEGGDYSDIAQDVMSLPPAQKDIPTQVINRPQVPAKTSPSPVTLPPKPSPKPVGLPDQPLDWRSDKARAQSPQPSTITGPSKSPRAKKPTLRTKLDKDSIRKAVSDAGGNVTMAAKKLGVSKEQIKQVLMA